MPNSEHCPVCDGGSNTANLSEFCSDACAMRASDVMVHAIEEAKHALAPFITREQFLDCMAGVADDLAIMPKALPRRPLVKTGGVERERKAS